MRKVLLKKIRIGALLSLIWLLLMWGLLWHFMQLQNNIMLFLLIIIIVLPLLCVAGGWLSARALSGEAVSTAFPKQNATRLDETYLLIRIHNRNFFPTPSLQLSFSVQNRFYRNQDIQTIDIPAIGARATEEIRFPLSPVHCGSVEVVLLSLRLGDWLGLSVWECPQNGQLIELLCFPALVRETVPLDESAGGSNEEVEPQEEKGYVSSEILDIRKYIPGDRLQAIHWKLSAKAGELMVKEYESMSADHFQLLPELNTGNPQQLDELLELLYGLGMQLINERGLHFSIYYWSDVQQRMISNPIREEADILTVLADIYHSEIPEQLIPGLALQHFRTYGAGRSGYMLYLSPQETLAEGEVIGCYREHIRIFEVLS